MKHFTLIFLIFSAAQIGLAQQKCLYNKDGVLFYLTFKSVSEKYNYQKDKTLYEKELYGYIVNKTDKQVNLVKATISLSNFSTNINNTISKQKIFSELNQPVKISPKSRKIVNLNSKVKYTSTPNMFGSIEFTISNPKDTIGSRKFQEIEFKEDAKSLNLKSCEDYYSNHNMELIPAGRPTWWEVKFYKEMLEFCPESCRVQRALADIYYEYKDKYEPNWVKNGIKNYQSAINLYNTRIDFEGYNRNDELWLMESYWRLANLFELSGLYEQAIANYNLLKKYSPKPEDLQARKNEKRIQELSFAKVSPEDENINYAEDATAHIIVCRFLMKNRPANITAAIAKDSIVSSAMLDRIDFSDQAIQQRSGFEPIRQMVEEVEKKQNYKTKDPNIKGKVIDVALLALGWAIAPKDMKVEQRNQFIMGTLSTVISLIDKDKVNVAAGGLSSSGMSSDLADLKTSPTAKTAEAAFNKVQPPAKTTTATETKKVETAGGVTITDKWESGDDISGTYSFYAFENCIFPGGMDGAFYAKTGHNSKNVTVSGENMLLEVTNTPYVISKYNSNYSFKLTHTSKASTVKGGMSTSTTECTGEIKKQNNTYILHEKRVYSSNGINTMNTNDIYEITLLHDHKISLRFISTDTPSPMPQNPNCSIILIKQ